jgi:hypothetical protein
VWERLRHRWAAIQSTVAPRLIAHALAPDIRQAVGGYLEPIGLHHLSYLVKLPGPPVLIDCAQGGSRRIAWSKQLSPSNHQQECNQRAFEDGKNGKQE